ncbi:aldehyde dehydrogenase family 3 member B1-like protein [Rhizoclosmatium globosum]|uniref:Aldehyde dehydrogenase n=1 Tax=Rhizoclosmatium globosum TaxID=329046 RepID=A0A1Y2CKY8_9FUNG|nr:aldehyde dehydrogenase family 3 member B1-like protein [Rhizoclosmatium globosum]|eukprot:ORY47627.1 aldehyde dehydrogenase family 3 member B1-like protein [Rhizoclosmatium globosum]
MASPTTVFPEITSSVAALRASFATNKTKAVSWRRKQLLSLYKFLSSNENLIQQVLFKDLHRPPAEVSSELVSTINEVVYALNNLSDWTKPVPCEKNPATLLDVIETRQEPLGVVLIISPFNYPVNLLVAPLVSALAAGNCVVLKPSEVASHTEQMWVEWVPKLFDSSCVKVVTGGIQETKWLLEQRLDKVFFTGSTTVGKSIAQTCAKNLVPLALELGGKCPVYVDESANIPVIARRIAWAKCMNNGQICLAPDYILAHTSVAAKLSSSLRASFKEFYSANPRASKEYGRLINRNHTQRVAKLLARQTAQAHSKVECGGEYSVEECFVAPTVISGVKPTDPLMEEEIFGPVVGIVQVSSVDEALNAINARERPLSIYVCTESKSVVDKFASSTSSGSLLVNDFYFNMTLEDMPFGGIGYSGIGKCHGHAGFLGTSSDLFYIN